MVLTLVVVVPWRTATAQGGGNSPTTPPAASTNIKRVLDKADPLAFLLDRKKALELNKPMEDSLKLLRKEMQRMEEVVYKDLDKAAAVKEQGQPLSATIVFSMTKESGRTGQGHPVERTAIVRAPCCPNARRSMPIR